MARIPVGPGRRVLPAGAPSPSAQDESGIIAGRALQQLGSAGEQIGQSLLASDTRLGVEENKKAVALEEMAARQKDQLQIQTTEDALRDAHDDLANGVLQGTIDKTQAAQQWQERSGKIIGDSMSGYREQSRPLAQTQLNSLGMRLGNSVRKVVEKKDRNDISAGIDQTLEYQQRQYMVDPLNAERVAMATVDQLGPFSDFTPDQLAKKKQAWKEGTQYAVGFNAVSSGRYDRKALDQADQLLANGLPDLDATKRASLQDRAQAYRFQQDQRAEQAAARAQREEERRLKLAEHTFNTYQTLADKGTMLDPAYTDQALAATYGTPYHAGITALARQAVETGGLAAQPVQTQRALLTAVDAEIARSGRSPALDKRREQINKVLQGSQTDIAQDPLHAGLQRGVITDLQPLNLQGGVAGLVEQLGARVTMADRVATWAGQPVAPLTSTEAENLAGMLGNMPSEQRATAVQTLAATMPARQAQALAALMDKKDRPMALALALGASRTTFDRPTAELVFKGAQALKDKTLKEDKTVVEGWTGTINTALQGVFQNPNQQQMTADAARYIVAGKVSEGGSLDINEAVGLAIGGKIGTVNGSKVVLPAGVSQSDLDNRLKAYPSADLSKQLPDGKVYVRGQPVALEQFLAGLPSAKLTTVGRGRYAVIGGGAVATNQAGNPVVVEVPYGR